MNGQNQVYWIGVVERDFVPVGERPCVVGGSGECGYSHRETEEMTSVTQYIYDVSYGRHGRLFLSFGDEDDQIVNKFFSNPYDMWQFADYLKRDLLPNAVSRRDIKRDLQELKDPLPRLIYEANPHSNPRVEMVIGLDITSSDLDRIVGEKISIGEFRRRYVFPE